MALIKTGTERLVNGTLKRLYEVHKFSAMAAGAFTSALEFSGARSIWVISTGASADFLIPPVDADGEALTATGDYRSMDAGSAGAYLAPTGSKNGYITGDAIPPYLCIKNTDASSADVTVFVTY